MYLIGFRQALGILISAGLLYTGDVDLKSSPGKNIINAAGNWTANFYYDNGLHIPFQFEIKKGETGEWELYFLNAEERFRSGNLVQKGDSLLAKLDPFDNEFVIHLQGDSIAGLVRRQDGKGNPLRLKAKKGTLSRFPVPANNYTPDHSGTYEVKFLNNAGKDDPSVALFKQEGPVLKASFLRITGDSRYLAGIVVNDSFFLSSYIGSSPAFYRGTINKDGKLSGETVNARGTGQRFEGELNEDAALPDAYELTHLREGYTRFDFNFPDIKGNRVSLADRRFQNKVVIVSIGGTWCPNCLDESVFLADWYKKNKNRGVEVVGIQYERSTDTAYLQKTISRFRAKAGIEYTQVIGGIADKQAVVESLPSLNSFLSFPTTIFINKNDEVVKIHTGFSGPATGRHYQAFVDEFNHLVDSLLKS